MWLLRSVLVVRQAIRKTILNTTSRLLRSVFYVLIDFCTNICMVKFSIAITRMFI